ncbi:MAG: RusA family crossover junction endodeoxyribonuclease [Actinomycetota bacterium]|nr:RusA family crossover junction endodeoxyribonuclease [Actinomycetota bacterium]
MAAEPISFRVGGEIPPVKSGAASMWRNPEQVRRIRALRRAAAQAMSGQAPLDEPVAVRVRVFMLGEDRRPPLWLRRASGDLDNLLAGVCDGLQAADPRGWDEATWSDDPPEIRPDRAVAFTDDSWVQRLEGEALPRSGEPAYEVELRPLERS